MRAFGIVSMSRSPGKHARTGFENHSPALRKILCAMCLCMCIYLRDSLWDRKRLTITQTVASCWVRFFLMSLCCQVYGVVCSLMKYCFSLNIPTFLHRQQRETTPAMPWFLLRDTAGGRGDSLWSRPATLGPSQEEEQGPTVVLF